MKISCFLQLMHSQTTEFMMEAMDVDSTAKMLLSFCAHPRDPGFCIALHSLAGESFFNFKVTINSLLLSQEFLNIILAVSWTSLSCILLALLFTALFSFVNRLLNYM